MLKLAIILILQIIVFNFLQALKVQVFLFHL